MVFCATDEAQYNNKLALNPYFAVVRVSGGGGGGLNVKDILSLFIYLFPADHLQFLSMVNTEVNSLA